MNTTPDTTTADNGGNFDPRQAAALLDQTTQQTRRQLEPVPPWLLVIRAVLALVVYGALWLSVRGQHPYAHPTAAVAPVGIAVGLFNLVAVTAMTKRATAGVRGRSQFRPVEMAVMVAVFVAVLLAMVPLADAGVSPGIAWGLWPATVPLMAGGLAWAGVQAARANWRAVWTPAAVAAVGAVAWAAGPAGSWAVAGVGLFLVLLGRAAAITWQQRRSVVRP
jgi:hypothetical protein